LADPRPSAWILLTASATDMSSFEIERTAEGNVVVYLPGAPNPWSGTVVYLEPGRVEKLDMSVADAVKSIQALGRGSAKYG